MDGTWEQSWDWNAPDWTDINNPDTSAVGFVYGNALTDDEKGQLDEFIRRPGGRCAAAKKAASTCGLAR